MKLLLCCLFLLAPALAFAQEAPRTIADCEAIKNDLAYNSCLASFGPKRGERRSSAAAVPANADDPPALRRGRRGGSSVRRGRRGRASASFEIGRRGVERRGARRARGRVTRAAQVRSRASRGYRSARRRR